MTKAYVAVRRGMWLRASPFGKRSGFVSVPAGNNRFSLAVLPKAWSEEGPRCHVARLEDGNSCHLTVHELDWIRLEGSPSVLGSLALSLGEVSGAGDEALVVPSPAPSPLPQERQATGQAVDAFNALLDLLLLAERGGFRMLADTRGPLASESWLRVLTHLRFVDALAGVMSHARPEYEERSEVLLSPRGRYRDRSVLYATHTGEPFIECVYDEHSMDTPLLRCVLAAVHVVASNPIPAPLSEIAGRLPRRAAHLALRLGSVALVPRREALRLASHIRLSRLQRVWEPVLELAQRVLADTAVPPLAGEAVTQAVAFHILTDKFWEQTVRESISRISHGLHVGANNVVPPGMQSLSPWASVVASASAETYPDFLFRYGSQVVVADAKYKLPDNSLNSADGYQMFAYSHLTRMEGDPVTACLVVSPRLPGFPQRHSLLVRGPDGDMPLVLLGLPFPGRDALRTRPSWLAYLSASASRLMDGLIVLDSTVPETITVATSH